MLWKFLPRLWNCCNLDWDEILTHSEKKYEKCWSKDTMIEELHKDIQQSVHFSCSLRVLQSLIKTVWFHIAIYYKRIFEQSHIHFFVYFNLHYIPIYEKDRITLSRVNVTLFFTAIYILHRANVQIFLQCVFLFNFYY